MRRFGKRSGYLGILQIDRPTTTGAAKFLDSVQSDSGASYGYTTHGDGYATSAEGLLCRMLMSWKRDRSELRRGIERLAANGPRKENLYFTYYATQDLYQLDAPDAELWKAWNNDVREYLIDAQSKAGHESGSWMFQGSDHGYETGGRLYCTTLSAMTLEVYYRYAPIYEKQDSDNR